LGIQVLCENVVARTVPGSQSKEPTGMVIRRPDLLQDEAADGTGQATAAGVGVGDDACQVSAAARGPRVGGHGEWLAVRLGDSFRPPMSTRPRLGVGAGKEAVEQRARPQRLVGVQPLDLPGHRPGPGVGLHPEVVVVRLRVRQLRGEGVDQPGLIEGPIGRAHLRQDLPREAAASL
jgi:hypothetical protein